MERVFLLDFFNFTAIRASLSTYCCKKAYYSLKIFSSGVVKKDAVNFLKRCGELFEKMR
jgi:hypothetical protein